MGHLSTTVRGMVGIACRDEGYLRHYKTISWGQTTEYDPQLGVRKESGLLRKDAHDPLPVTDKSQLH